ncbi:MAG: hypothetical protein NZ739_11475 [Verrucomicrobiae bacterium]|nr:hypothetical protein [Verrucomicrobiae bacterium]MDW7979129.1 hypothetical protein [Verrucomicrobiales bacterium]
MALLKVRRAALMLLALAALVSVGAGCASTAPDPELSPRPWNAPKSWETGIPPGLYERQR